MTHHSQDPATDTHEHVHEPEPAHTEPARGDQVNVNASSRGGTHVAEPGPLAMVRRVLGLLFGILIVLIGLRILLLMLGANEGNPLVDGIYGITEIFVAPFRGVFSIDEVRPTGNSAIDVAAIVALVGWALIALLVVAILRLGDRTASA